MPRVGAPVDVGPARNSELEQVYGNHSSDDKHPIQVWEKAKVEVKTRRAI